MSGEIRIKTRRRARSLALVLGNMLAATAFAHHSFAMYDQSKVETMTGKLTRFIPGANHAQLIFDVVGPDGKTQLGPDGKAVVWGIELGPAATIAQQGVTVEAFQPGTVITVALNPLRNGKNFGAMASDSNARRRRRYERSRRWTWSSPSQRVHRRTCSFTPASLALVDRPSSSQVPAAAGRRP